MSQTNQTAELIKTVVEYLEGVERLVFAVDELADVIDDVEEVEEALNKSEYVVRLSDGVYMLWWPEWKLSSTDIEVLRWLATSGIMRCDRYDAEEIERLGSAVLSWLCHKYAICHENKILKKVRERL